MDEEGWRRFGIDVDVRRRVFVGLPAAPDAVGHGVHGNQEVRAARFALNRIDRARVASVPLRTDGNGKMATGREPQHADAVLRDTELAGPLSNQAHGPQPVEQRNRRVVALADTVAKDERGDAASIQPARDLKPLVVRCEDAVAAARSDDDTRPSGQVSWRQVDGELRAVDVEITDCARCAVRPERDRDVSQWSSRRRRREWSARSGTSPHARTGRWSARPRPPCVPSASWGNWR